MVSSRTPRKVDAVELTDEGFWVEGSIEIADSISPIKEFVAPETARAAALDNISAIKYNNADGKSIISL
jgi:hypothetical protein